MLRWTHAATLEPFKIKLTEGELIQSFWKEFVSKTLIPFQGSQENNQKYRHILYKEDNHTENSAYAYSLVMVK